MIFKDPDNKMKNLASGGRLPSMQRSEILIKFLIFLTTYFSSLRVSLNGENTTSGHVQDAGQQIKQLRKNQRERKLSILTASSRCATPTPASNNLSELN